MAEAEAELDKAGGAGQVSKDLFSGAVGGIAQVLIGIFAFSYITAFKTYQI
jgi:hypothetical protein